MAFTTPRNALCLIFWVMGFEFYHFVLYKKTFSQTQRTRRELFPVSKWIKACKYTHTMKGDGLDRDFHYVPWKNFHLFWCQQLWGDPSDEPGMLR